MPSAPRRCGAELKDSLGAVESDVGIEIVNQVEVQISDPLVSDIEAAGLGSVLTVLAFRHVHHVTALPRARANPSFCRSRCICSLRWNFINSGESGLFTPFTEAHK